MGKRSETQEEQFSFDFFASDPGQVAPPPEPESAPAGKTPAQGDANHIITARRRLCRSAMAWLLRQKPLGMAMAVPTRFSRYQADIAAFWSVPGKKILTPEATMIVEVRHDRSACWPDCGNHDELLALLRAARIEQDDFEADIRQSEPQLKDSDTLFDDFQHWNYERSENVYYHQCRKRVEKLEHALYKGSRFEQLRRAHVADYHYLAVPEGTVAANELAYGWGLLYITDAGHVKVIREAFRRDCSPAGRHHLIQNIAAAAMKDVLFAQGVRATKDGRLVFSPLPKRRNKIESEYCQDE